MYIACPKCDWRPDADDRWICDCQNIWHTFDTHGICPACGKTWQETYCLACGAWSDHEDWYHDENELTVAEYLADPQRASLALFPDNTPTLSSADREALEDTLLKTLEAFVAELDQLSTQDQPPATASRLPSAEALEAIFRGITDPQDVADMKQLKARSRQPAPTDGYVTLLVPIGPIPLTASLAAAEALKATFIHEVALGGPMDPPPEAYRSDRRQYRAVPLLNTLQRYARPGIFRVIGLIDADIYLPGTNFVFGTQFPGSRAILLGLRRLHGPTPCDAPEECHELRRRVATTVVSQVSASLGLGPCRNEGCARAPSNSLADTDRKTAQLCPSCAAQIAAWLKPSYRRRS